MLFHISCIGNWVALLSRDDVASWISCDASGAGAGVRDGSGSEVGCSCDVGDSNASDVGWDDGGVGWFSWLDCEPDCEVGPSNASDGGFVDVSWFELVVGVNVF